MKCFLKLKIFKKLYSLWNINPEFFQANINVELQTPNPLFIFVWVWVWHFTFYLLVTLSQSSVDLNMSLNLFSWVLYLFFSYGKLRAANLISEPANLYLAAAHELQFFFKKPYMNCKLQPQDPLYPPLPHTHTHTYTRPYINKPILRTLTLTRKTNH